MVGANSTGIWVYDDDGTGTLAGQIAGVDTYDPTNTFLFLVTGGDSMQAMLLNELDYENITSYQVVLVLHDNAPVPFNRSTRATFTITVTDANDNTPVFVNLTAGDVIAIPETVALSQVYQFYATDADSTTNGILSFSEAGYNFTRSVLAIDQGGVLQQKIGSLL